MGWKRLQNPQIQKRLRIRAQILASVREFFIKEGFLEVETPILVPAAGQEPHLDPMKVEFTTPNPSSERRGNESISSPARGEVRRGGSTTGYLITSPEYAHKKMLAAGFEKTFEITRAFRAGEQWGGLHNPEFTILEWYRANADYTKIMEDVEKMAAYIIKALKHESIKAVGYQGKTIDLSSPWQRLSVAEAFEKYAGMPRGKHAFLCDRTRMREWCKGRGYNVSKGDTCEDLFFKIFLTEIEPKLGFPKPTILYDYPASMAALAKIKNVKCKMQNSGDECRVAERFELYIAGIELANAFSELNDAAEQRRRFLEEQKLRAKLGKEIIPLDEDFLDAVAHMPPSAGIAFGVDRLVMLLTNAASIEDVLAFPASSIFPPLKVRGGAGGVTRDA